MSSFPLALSAWGILNQLLNLPISFLIAWDPTLTQLLHIPSCHSWSGHTTLVPSAVQQSQWVKEALTDPFHSKPLPMPKNFAELTTSNHRHIEWFGLKEDLEDHLVPTLFTRPGCLELHPTWPCPQFHWTAYYSVSPPSQERFFS